MSNWFDRENEKVKGVPLSRVPGIVCDKKGYHLRGRSEREDALDMLVHLETALIELDRLRAENEELKSEHDSDNLLGENMALAQSNIDLQAELKRAKDHYASCLCDVARDAWNACLAFVYEPLTPEEADPAFENDFKAYWASKTKGGER